MTKIPKEIFHGIWKGYILKNGERIMIDCDFKTKTFTLKFNGDDFEVAIINRQLYGK